MLAGARTVEQILSWLSSLPRCGIVAFFGRASAMLAPWSRSGSPRAAASWFALWRKLLVAERLQLDRRADDDEGPRHRTVTAVAGVGQSGKCLRKTHHILGQNRVFNRLHRRSHRRHVAHGNAGVKPRGLHQTLLELSQFVSREIPIARLAGVPELDR